MPVKRMMEQMQEGWREDREHQIEAARKIVTEHRDHFKWLVTFNAASIALTFTAVKALGINLMHFGNWWIGPSMSGLCLAVSAFLVTRLLNEGVALYPESKDELLGNVADVRDFMRSRPYKAVTDATTLLSVVAFGASAGTIIEVIIRTE